MKSQLDLFILLMRTDAEGDYLHLGKINTRRSRDIRELTLIHWLTNLICYVGREDDRLHNPRAVGGTYGKKGGPTNKHMEHPRPGCKALLIFARSQCIQMY